VRFPKACQYLKRKSLVAKNPSPEASRLARNGNKSEPWHVFGLDDSNPEAGSLKKTPGDVCVP